MKRLVFLTLLFLTTVLSMAQAPDYSSYILTPPAPETPLINGPKVYGATPKAEFLYRIPVSGRKPMQFSAKGLPKGLKLDTEKGIISGKVSRKGVYKVQLTATNELGSDTMEMRIEIGGRIALTPPMGWNSWNCHGNTVSQEHILQAARTMEEKGLTDYGWCYVNIDDGWQGLRGGKYNAIQPNSKFTDMKALADSLHARGLKLGIYSVPWTASYAGHIGSSCDTPDGRYWWVEKGMVDEYMKLDETKYAKGDLHGYGKYSFAAADARQWAAWGVDYLKYDWFLNDIRSLREMRDALDATGRDIVYSISNATRIALGPWMGEMANCWRTAGDITDTWGSISSIAFDREASWPGYCSPSHWPDADMMVLGKVGGWDLNPHWTRLTPWEQYSHVTAWAILASPLLIGCDMAELDDFTLSLLCNREVIAINQDPLGAMGVKNAFGSDKNRLIYVKLLEDGTLAVALFNLKNEESKVSFCPRELGLYGVQKVRDLWRQQDVGEVHDKERWEVVVPAHGCALYRVSPGVTDRKLEGKWWEIK
ncbi:MAG: putative Ig domain-containing protein [Bacteroidales bacterium]|nr:putative Ig domain-containing protein [Bacteroidales bacterium]